MLHSSQVAPPAATPCRPATSQTVELSGRVITRESHGAGGAAGGGGGGAGLEQAATSASAGSHLTGDAPGEGLRDRGPPAPPAPPRRARRSGFRPCSRARVRGPAWGCGGGGG